jgi:hypothetical protein
MGEPGICRAGALPLSLYRVQTKPERQFRDKSAIAVARESGS